jgi:hypothetical protein
VRLRHQSSHGIFQHDFAGPAQRGSKSGSYVGLFEILSLQEEWLARDFSKRIGEAIAEVQSGCVPALAEVEESLAREMSLFKSERFDADTGSAKKDITLTACVWSDLAFNDYREFNEVCRAH